MFKEHKVYRAFGAYRVSAVLKVPKAFKVFKEPKVLKVSKEHEDLNVQFKELKAFRVIVVYKA